MAQRCTRICGICEIHDKNVHSGTEFLMYFKYFLNKFHFQCLFFLSSYFGLISSPVHTHTQTQEDTQRTCFYGIMRFFSADISLANPKFIHSCTKHASILLYITHVHTNTHTQDTLMSIENFHTLLYGRKYSVLLIIITKVC